MDQSLELAILDEFLRSHTGLWQLDSSDMEDLSSGVAFVRACGALYRAVRKEFPNLELTSRALDLLCEAKREIPEPPGGYWDTEERGRGGWQPLPATIVSAVTLSRRGEIEDVLVTAALSSHGYDYFGGQGRALAEGYTELVPAIVSSLGAPWVIGGATYDVPPWYSQDGYRDQIRLSPLTLALSPMLTEDQRRVLLLRGVEESGSMLHAGDEIVFQDGLWFVVDDLIVVATELGVDLSPFVEAEDLDQVLSEWTESLDHPEDPDVADQLLEGYLAVLVTRYVQNLDASYLSLSFEERRNAHPWLEDWRPWQLTGEGVWPPTIEAIRQANRENN